MQTLSTTASSGPHVAYRPPFANPWLRDTASVYNNNVQKIWFFVIPDILFFSRKQCLPRRNEEKRRASFPFPSEAIELSHYIPLPFNITTSWNEWFPQLYFSCWEYCICGVQGKEGNDSLGLRISLYMATLAEGCILFSLAGWGQDCHYLWDIHWGDDSHPSSKLTEKCLWLHWNAGKSWCPCHSS